MGAMNKGNYGDTSFPEHYFKSNEVITDTIYIIYNIIYSPKISHMDNYGSAFQFSDIFFLIT